MGLANKPGGFLGYLRRCLNHELKRCIYMYCDFHPHKLSKIS